jgi:predicted nucleic acid-binding protein
MNSCLLDTGPIVAFLDRDEPDHATVKGFLADFQGQLTTTAAVLTEAFHFLSSQRDGPAQLVAFIERSDLRIHEVFEATSLRAVAELMAKYVDCPMDFADGTLVLTANQLQIDRVLTLDRRGFATFRHHRNRRFKLVLDER